MGHEMETNLDQHHVSVRVLWVDNSHPHLTVRFAGAFACTTVRSMKKVKWPMKKCLPDILHWYAPVAVLIVYLGFLVETRCPATRRKSRKQRLQIAME